MNYNLPSSDKVYTQILTSRSHCCEYVMHYQIIVPHHIHDIRLQNVGATYTVEDGRRVKIGQLETRKRD